MADFSGAQNTVRLSFHGSKIRPGYAPWERDEQGRPKRYRQRLPYTYPCPPDAQVSPVAANGVAQVSVPLDMEAAFLCEEITVQWQGAGTVFVDDFGGRDRRWMDRPVHVGLFGGSGLWPNRLPSPRYLYQGSSLTVTFTDLSAASNRWRVYFHGVKLYEG
jgi:hypothetical protein